MEMKKLLLNILLMLLILFLGSIILNEVVYGKLKITPWYSGSELIQQKRNRILKSDNKYNTLLIGSSRVYRQIDPAILDSATAGKANTQSYNFGINWLFSPETFYVYEQLVNNEKLNFKFVVIELSKIPSVDYSNLHTTRTTYWYNWKLYNFVINTVWHANFSLGEKVYLSGIHTISFIDKLINLGYLTNAIAFNDKQTFKQISFSDNGYEPLSKSEKNSGGAFAEENAGGRRQVFLSDTSVVTKRKAISKNKFQKYDDHPELLEKYNKFYADALNSMAADAKKSGTHLIFLLSPRIDASQYDELIPLFHHLHPDHRIEISDSRKNPELYLSANSFDETHLNDEGAKIYSTILGKKINELGAGK
jgi:hypothetical protein